MINSLFNNRRLLILPNELFEAGGEGIFLAHDGNSLAMTLSTPVVLPDGKICTHLVASVRHEARNISEIMDGKTVLCALSLVPDEKFDPLKPCDVSWWRGGGAVIGDIRAANLDSRQ